MLARIRALNSDSSEESDSDDSEKELTLTKEALEELVIKEYNRALNLQKAGKTEISERLMRELLETDILHETAKPSVPDSVDRPILKVKYCLHLNLAKSADKKGDYNTALRHYCMACDLDGTDCLIWYKLGKLAMQLDRFDIAKQAFDRGLVTNPNHWMCLDTLIRLLYVMGDADYCLHYIELAIKTRPNYTRGHYLKDLIFEERPFLKEYYPKLEFPEYTYEHEDIIEYISDIQNLSERWCRVEPDEEMKEVKNIPAFGGEELSWMSVGNALLGVFKFMKENAIPMVQTINLAEILSQEIVMKIEEVKDDDVDDSCTSDIKYALESILMQNREVLKNQCEQNASPEQINGTSTHEISSDENAYSSDKQTTDISDTNEKDGKDSDINNINKDSNKELEVNGKPEQPSSRITKKRRASDLTLLEQWGRSKQRRSSRKKNNDRDCSKQYDDDETVEEALKRILPASLLTDGLKIWKSKRLEHDVHSEDSMNTMDLYELFEPNQNDKPNANPWSIGEHRAKSPTEEELREFVDIEKIGVVEFINKYKNESCDVPDIMKDWLSNVSRLGYTVWPNGLPEVYVNVYLCFREVYAEHPWMFTDEINLLREDAEITLMFAEFYLDLRVWNENNDGRSITSTSNKRVFMEDLSFLEWLCCRDDLFLDCLNNYIRVHWLKSQYLLAQKHSHQAIECLQNIIETLTDKKAQDIKIKLSNSKINNVISLSTATTLLKKLERMESLYSVEELYEKQEYDKVAEILYNSLTCNNNLINNEEIGDNIEDKTFPRPTLLHILLESLWATENFKDCLICSVSCLNECCQKYFTGCVGPAALPWASTIQSALLYIEALLKLEDPGTALKCLSEQHLVMLVQCLCNIVVHQLNDRSMKICQNISKIDIILPWILLYHITCYQECRGRYDGSNKSRYCPGYSKIIVERHLSRLNNGEISSPENDIEDESDLLPSVQLLFTAHQYLGKRSLCTAKNGALLLFTLNRLYDRVKYDSLKDILQENLEQCCYCLYGHPLRKNKPRYITEHEANPIKMHWDEAHMIYEVFRPIRLVEFDSRITAINAETESIFQRLIQLIPEAQKLQMMVSAMNEYIFGSRDSIPEKTITLPPQLSHIYYLLGDFYLKSREFHRAIRLYTTDVCLNPTRLDSWAGMALSMAAQLDTKLNSCDKLKNESEFLDKAFAAVRCFQQTMDIDSCHCVLLIEFGSFAYSVHSYCSRMLKQASETLSMEKFSMLESRKESMLQQAYDCFSKAQQLCRVVGNHEQDERWLYHYMLGKIAEKQRKEPFIYLNHYWEASRLLEENNACYPRKINYSNPQHLAVEALEVFYRLHASMLKYLEHHDHNNISRELGDLFMKHLVKASNGPFGNPILAKSVNNNGNKEASTQNELQSNSNKHKLTTVTEEEEEDCSQKKIPRIEGKTDVVMKTANTVSVINEDQPKTPTPVTSQITEIEPTVPAVPTPEKQEIQSEKISGKSDDVIVIPDSDEDATILQESENTKSAEETENIIKTEDGVRNEEQNGGINQNGEESKMESLTIVDSQERLNYLMKECLEKMEFTDETTDAETEAQYVDAMSDASTKHTPRLISPIGRTTPLLEEINQIEEVKKSITEPIKETNTDPSSRRTSQETRTSSSSSSTGDMKASTSSSSDESSSEDSSSSDGSSSDSSSDSSSEESDETSRSSKVSKTSKTSIRSQSSKASKSGKKSKKKSKTLSQPEIDKIVSFCITSLEECIHRCPQHYKAFYRLGYHYLKHGNISNTTGNTTGNSGGVTVCRQLLLAVYNPGTDRQIQGLFSERKSTNFFNGIWRLPASDVDRAGSFASHMSRCVLLLLEVLKESGDHKILLELCLQLQKIPDADKKYLRDPERVELSQQALTLCIQTLRVRLKKLSETKVHQDMIAFILDVYRSYKKAQKHLVQKDKFFSSLLIDAYKICKVGKEPDGSHLLDTAIRFCQQQLTARKQKTQLPPTVPVAQATHMATPPFQVHSTPIIAANTVPAATIVSTAPATSITANAVVTQAPRPRGRPPNNPANYQHNYPKNVANENFSSMLVNQYMTLLNGMSMNNLHGSPGFSQFPDLYPGNLGTALNMSPSKSPYNSYANNAYMNNNLESMFKNFFQNNVQQMNMAPGSSTNKFMNTNNLAKPAQVRKPKKPKQPKVVQEFMAQNLPRLPINDKLPQNKMTIASSQIDVNKKDYLPVNTSITCTPISSKELPTKAHLHKIPGMTITPVQQPAHSNQQNVNQETIPGSMLKPPPPHIQTSPGKTLQQKLAEKKKNPNKLMNVVPDIVKNKQVNEVAKNLFKQGGLEITKCVKRDQIKVKPVKQLMKSTSFSDQPTSSFNPSNKTQTTNPYNYKNIPYMIEQNLQQKSNKIGYNKPEEALTITAANTKLQKHKSLEVNNLDSLKYIANLPSSVTLTKATVEDKNPKIQVRKNLIAPQNKPVNKPVKEKMVNINPINASVSVIQSKPVQQSEKKIIPDVIVIDDD